MIAKLLIATLVTLPAAAQQPATNQPAPGDSGQPGRSGFQGRQFKGVFGNVTEISGSALKIQQANGTTATVNTSGNTQFRKERQPIKLSDIKIGDNVAVRGNSSGENAWTADVVSVVPSREQMQARFREALGKTMVIGDVKSVDAPKLTIQRVDGAEQIIEADENTSFRKGREDSITLPDVHVGDTVMASGELKNGVFVPVLINVMDPEMAKRMKERGMGGSSAAGSNSGTSASPQQTGQQAQQPPKQ
jgi:hypothetical protein